MSAPPTTLPASRASQLGGVSRDTGARLKFGAAASAEM
jgi:hypothetical protein